MKLTSKLFGVILFLFFVFLLATLVHAQPGEARKAASIPKMEIPNTEVQGLTSSSDGQEYVLYVYLPEGYSTSTKTYPVLYLMDAQWDFPMVTGLVQSQADDGFVPQMIVVGITWGGNNPNYGYLRFKDFTPSHNDRFPQSGNGPKFLAFLKKEMMPFIESKYRASKSDRTIMGNSLGGFFGLYAMFVEPGLFNRFILSSPTLGYNGGVAAFEKEYAAKSSRLPARLFIDVGELEGAHIPQVEELARTLKARNYRDLIFETQVIPSTGHSSNKPEGFTKGLQAVFAPLPLAIDAAVLEEYVGKYQFPRWQCDIVKEQNSLYFVIPEGTKYLLNPTSETDFYTRGTPMVIHFKRNEAGKVSGFETEPPDGKGSFVEKIDRVPQKRPGSP
jgi:predicted alpha/beta superfamily hydrolase